ncbi:hypothetical protein CVT25_012950 [Psilocybe cyanescens]|uniref:Uncharacterized protein n=1 Tax=Psilocybe cyanescens TaxID=93625 RepID=A0A409XFB7_PSICY|nr:hypothetical protein CVT25_012950 [Psilocybe cyanescens]
MHKEDNINAQGGQYGNGLQAACYKGHEAIVKLLLENKADIIAQGGQYGNALQTASTGGHKTIVMLLQENLVKLNADINGVVSDSGIQNSS